LRGGITPRLHRRTLESLLGDQGRVLFRSTMRFPWTARQRARQAGL